MFSNLHENTKLRFNSVLIFASENVFVLIPLDWSLTDFYPVSDGYCGGMHICLLLEVI